MLGKPSGAWGEGRVLNCASFGLRPSVEAGPTHDTALLCCLGTSCCCMGTAVGKDALLAVVEHAVGSSSKSFLPARVWDAKDVSAMLVFFYSFTHISPNKPEHFSV